MIPNEAVEAAAKVLCEQMWDNAHEKQRAYAREEAREALEAAAPYMLADAKDRVGKRYARLHQMLRYELQAQAWDRGMGDQLKLLEAGPGYEMGNPYRRPRP